jgi:hypothetical protein
MAKRLDKTNKHDVELLDDEIRGDLWVERYKPRNYLELLSDEVNYI